MGKSMKSRGNDRRTSDEDLRAAGNLAALAAVVLALAITVALIWRAPARAQVDLGGYYEHTLQADYHPDVKETVMDASKLRVDFSSGLAGGLLFTGNLNFIVYHGRVSRDIRPFLPPSVRAELEAEGIPATVTLERERHYVDNAFLTWEKGHVRLRAGKQQLSWGPAYAFNPTDLFHRKNQLDPTYEKEGVTALRLDATWGIGGDLTAVWAPGDRFAEAGYALRLATHLAPIGYDVALTAHSVTDSTAFDPDTWTPYTQRRRALGLEFSGSLLGLGVWCEGNWNEMEIEPDFARAAFGFDYTLGSGLYLMAEALYNGRAEAGKPYPVHDWFAYIAYGEPVGRWWYLAGVSREVSDLTMGSLYFFGTPDGSYVLNPRLDISIAQNADLIIFGGFTFGTDEGAFPPGMSSVVARATVWFSGPAATGGRRRADRSGTSRSAGRYHPRSSC